MRKKIRPTYDIFKIKKVHIIFNPFILIGNRPAEKTDDENINLIIRKLEISLIERDHTRTYKNREIMVYSGGIRGRQSGVIPKRNGDRPGRSDSASSRGSRASERSTNDVREHVRPSTTSRTAVEETIPSKSASRLQPPSSIKPPNGLGNKGKVESKLETKSKISKASSTTSSRISSGIGRLRTPTSEKQQAGEKQSTIGSTKTASSPSSGKSSLTKSIAKSITSKAPAPPQRTTSKLSETTGALV